MENTIWQLVTQSGTLNTGQTLIEVKIISADIFDCTSQVVNTTLDDSIQTFMNDTFESGEFVVTLQNMTAEAIKEEPSLANDTLLSEVDKLNEAAAFGDMTAFVMITTSAPSLSPSTNPSENPSGSPSVSVSPFDTPSGVLLRRCE